MAASKELVQHIDVKGTVKGCNKARYNLCLDKIMFEFEKECKMKLSRVVQRVGHEVSDVAKYQQHAGLMHYRAIFTRRLYDSIALRQLSQDQLHASYDVATTLHDKYPLALIKGRPKDGNAVLPVRKKALTIRLTPDTSSKVTPKGSIVRPKAKASKPKNYMKFSDEHLHPMIPGMIRRYVNELFR